MKAKEIYILLVLAVVLVGLAIWFSKEKEAVMEQAAPPTREVLAGVTSNTVERIEIAVPEQEPVTLTKRDSLWYTNVQKGHRADKNLVRGLFSSIEKPISGEVVSEKPENFGEYQVNETSATRVKFYGNDNKLLSDLYVGKAGGQAFSTYVRKADSEEVINANAALTYAFSKPEGWRDKQVFDIASDTITKVEATGTSATFTLAKADGNWKLEAPAAAEAQMSKVQPLVNTLGTLRASDFVETTSGQPLAEFGLEPPVEKLTIRYEDRATSPAKSDSATLLLGTPKAGTSVVYAKRADAENVFTITQYQAELLTPKVADLRVTPPPPPAAPESEAKPTTAAEEKTTVPQTPAPQPEAAKTTAAQTQQAVTTPEAGETTPAEKKTTEPAKKETGAPVAPPAPAPVKPKAEAAETTAAEAKASEPAKQETVTPAAPAAVEPKAEAGETTAAEAKASEQAAPAATQKKAEAPPPPPVAEQKTTPTLAPPAAGETSPTVSAP